MRGGGESGGGRRRWLALLPLLILGLLVAVALGRILLYRQTDDPVRVASKRAYLERISTLAPQIRERPNLVVILFDDLGYGDFTSYGSRSIATPSLDRLAAEGALLRHAYATSPYCSASRAGLLTGRYPVRMGLDHVVQAPGTFTDALERFGGLNRRLPLEEIALPELLSAAGYATGLVGKWHLGDLSPSLPNDRGFDSFFGLLHSNDQGEPVVWRDRQVVEPHPIDQSTLTRRYTREAVGFLEAHAGEPFFLYLAHTFPHIPLHVTPDRLGRSAAGLYGDVVEELDESVATVVETLDRLGLAEQTLVLVTSDNGAWFQGSTGGLRGRKFHVFEGGMRVPFLVRWPERIEPGVLVDRVSMGIDLFPTVLDLLDLPPPADRTLDGESLLPALSGEEQAERGAIFFHQLGPVRALRKGRFKLHDRHYVLFGNPMNWPWAPMKARGPWLFDLELDPEEVYDVSARHPQQMERLLRILEERRRELQENLGGWQ